MDEEELEDKSFDENFLPFKTTSRLLRQKLPRGLVISREVKTLLNRSGSIFIVYLSAIAGEIANDNQTQKKKLIINPDTIKKALKELEFSTIASAIFQERP